MENAMGVTISAKSCTGCGLCVRLCPDRVLTIVDGKAAAGGDCMACGHCEAVCPTGAARVDVLTADFAFKSFDGGHYLPPGRFDPASLASLMRSRRSCRAYTGTPVDSRLIDDLVTLGITAPSGTNSQKWTFTILPTRDDVAALGALIAAFYIRLNHKARNPWLRLCAKLFHHDALGRYYRRHYRSVCRALDDWRRNGTDRLFHGATAVILIGSAPGASCPAEDAMLAAGNIVLAAHALGLGTCLIGYAVEAVNRDPSIKKRLGLAADETVNACVALGHPAERFRRPAGRRQPLTRTARLGKEELP